MPKVANYFVRPEGVNLSPATVTDIQYGEAIESAKKSHSRMDLCYWDLPGRGLYTSTPHSTSKGRIGYAHLGAIDLPCLEATDNKSGRLPTTRSHGGNW